MAETAPKWDKRYGTEILPPEGHKDVGVQLFAILEEILTDKNQLGLPEKWFYFYRLSRNKHWKGTTKKANLLSANLLFTHRQRTTNMLTDNNPTFNVRRIGAPEGREHVYDDLLYTCQFWWHDQEQQPLLEKSIINAETYGCCVEKMTWNPELEGRLGQAETVIVDPYHFGLYPVGGTDIQKAQAVLHFYPMNVREARRTWPKFANKIKGDQERIKELGDERRELITGKANKASSWSTTFQSTVRQMVGNTEGMAGTEGDETLIVEAWIKDYTMLTLIDEEEGVEITMPKYSGHIRQVTACNGGEIVLQDIDNPSINPDLEPDLARQTYLWDHFPFSFTQSNTDPSNIWGMGDYEQLEGIQIEYNKTISQFNMFKDRASRLKIINPKGSGVPNAQLNNYPGIVRPSNALMAQAIKYIEPPRAPLDLQNALNVYKELFFLVAGTFELEMAQTPGREVVAYKAIAALLERAALMLRGKDRNYGGMIRERGRMAISMFQNWYVEKRQITYLKDGEEKAKQVLGKDLIIPTRLAVVSGSTMPVSRVQEREEARELFAGGAIDNEELLKKLGWDDYRSVIKRMLQGPLSGLFDKMMAIGTPESVVNVMQELFAMDQPDFEKAMKQGEIPNFYALIPDPQTGQMPTDPMEELERMLKEAELYKIQADIGLLAEKAKSEQVDQFVKMFGTELDEESLKIKKAEMFASLLQAIDKNKNEKIRSVANLIKSTEQKGQGPYRERGMKSNNKEV
jgi:hypothetical protein